MPALRRLWVFAFLVLAAPALCADAYLRHPTIHGDLIAFSSEGDIWLAPATGGEARRLTTHPGQENDPLFSPDGTRIVFTGEYDGGPDLYVIGAEGGSPLRITWDSDRRVRAVAWSADGSEVLFRSRRQNGEWHERLWKVSAKGGLPQLLPVPRAEHAALDPSGRRIAFVPVSGEWQHWRGYRGGQADDLWLTDLQTRTFRRLTSDPTLETTPVWVGNDLYFVSDRDGTSNLFRYDLASGAATEMTHFTDYDVLYPSSDGRRIVFEHGNGIGLYDPATSRALPISITLPSDRIHVREHPVPAADGLRNFSIGPTGKRVAVESRGQILTVPAGDNDWRLIEAAKGARAQYPAWSRDGKWIAFVSDRSGEEQVWLAPAAGSAEPRQLTRDHKGPLGKIVWSPDGARLATGDREMRILLVDAATGATTLVAQADRGGSYDTTNDSYRFSPDGKWLAYELIEPNWNRSVWLYDIGHRTATRLTSPAMDSWAPEFDPSGKYLYFISMRDLRPSISGPNRTFGFDKAARLSVISLAADTRSPFLKLEEEEGLSTAPATEEKSRSDEKKKKNGSKDEKGSLPQVKVDLPGIAERIADVPVDGDRYVRAVPLEDRILLLVQTEESDAPDPDAPRFQLRSLSLKDLRKHDLTVVAEKLSDFEVSADGKMLAIRTGKSLAFAPSDSAPVKDAVPAALEKALLVVDPASEWKQMFNETWRIGRDFFYDPGMHGVDWVAMKKKYEALLPAVGDRSELNVVLGDLVSELNVGHAYIRGGDIPDNEHPPVGHLGADLQADPGRKAWRITRILPGDTFDLENRSPLLAPGVGAKVGDYIVAVSGQPVSTDQPIEAMLTGTAGRLISISLNSTPAKEGARTVLVRPIAREDLLRYYDWVEGRREYVRKNGGEKITYVHLPNMNTRGMQEFTKQYYPNVNGDGVIFDVRNNGGGWISAMLLAQIADRPRTWFKPRYGASWTRVDWGSPGYRVALCDDQSYSNAEEFCDAFQRMKVGPVIGTTTWGGEVGSGGGYPLIDGGLIFIPNYAAWSPTDGWIIEGRGVSPDIETQQDPAALLAGRDPQLDRAIAYINEQVAKSPVPHPEPPAFPIKVRR